MGLIFRLLLAFSLVGSAAAQSRFITVASTTSTEQSGLFKHLLPVFEKKTGIQVRVVALGTGQALDMGRRGDADVVFVHAKPLEEKFLAEGFGVKRQDVMYNDFVLIGPKSDPAKVGRRQGHARGLPQDPGGAGGLRFARRQERDAFRRARDLEGGGHRYRARTRAPWYRDTGQGMGPALNTAAGMNAYILADRGTWLSFKNRGELAVAGRGRQAALQPVRDHAGESAEASERQEGARPGVHRLGRVARGAEARSPTTRSTASSFSSRTPNDSKGVMRRYRGLTLRVLSRTNARHRAGQGRADRAHRRDRLDLGGRAGDGHVLSARVAARRGAERGLSRAGGDHRDRRQARRWRRGDRVRPALVRLFRAMEDKASAAIAADLKRFESYLR